MARESKLAYQVLFGALKSLRLNANHVFQFGDFFAVFSIFGIAARGGGGTPQSGVRMTALKLEDSPY